MRLKKAIISLLTILGIVCILGGCGMGGEELTLTKEQQDNVVRWIVRNYEVDAVEFIKFEKDVKTGFYLLSVQLNSDKKLSTTLSIRQIEELDEKNIDIGLNPVNRFKSIERKVPLDEAINLSQIEIIYLEE